eukprot:scaffold16813_cov194-Skeletonema_menzelii.AAC.1
MHGYIGNNGKSDASATTGWKDDVNIHGAPFTQWGYRLSDDPSLLTCPLDSLGGSTIGTSNKLCTIDHCCKLTEL